MVTSAAFAQYIPFLVAACCSTLAVAQNATTLTDSPIVTISRFGQIQGNRSQYINSVYNFKNISYASAPSGANRWRHPPHPSPWTGIRDATQFGPVCPQKSLGASPDPPYQSEDCLSLNIWTPANASLNNVVNNTQGVGVIPGSGASKYPVYVWIYGGRFSGGSASDARYEGAGLAAKGVVVVTMNYRLGALGFLAHPELSNSSRSGTSGNYGLVDQQAALHWTNENIASFGGDPTRITIGGQSAGAASVIANLNSPLAKGLFTGVIAESGVRYSSDPLIGSVAQSYRNLSTAEEQGVAFLKSLNVSTIEEARALPVSVFLAGSNGVDTTFDNTPLANNSIYGDPPLFRPVLDGYVLPRTYNETLRTGQHAGVSVMTGNNKDESGASPNPGYNTTSYTAVNEATFGSVGLADQFFSLYPASSANSSQNPDNSSNAFYRDAERVGTWLWANEYSAGAASNPVYNAGQNASGSVFTYYWTHAPPGQSQGAYHMSEINYAFNNLYATDSPWTAQDYQIADTLSTYWANFIATGNPNGPGLITWPENKADSPNTMEVGNAWKPIPVADQSHIEFVREWFSKWPTH
ncbi:carboxylesterase [Microthyrium microscopicum]|uniref:Carboxylic ester hydrolase n=1 Tax=Microthyrium microscopicum TaxID=703497 RepID=A0A6A6U4X1_9PEZI|nr:carboxylesterase [Microthyrium microscopicum]